MPRAKAGRPRLAPSLGSSAYNPWKLATLGMGVVLATALVTGVVVAHYNGGQAAVTPDQTAAAQPTDQGAAQAPPAAGQPAAQPVPPQASAANQAPSEGRRVAAHPSEADIRACNRYAYSVHRDTGSEAVKDALIGGLTGAGLGAAGGAIAGGGGGAGKGAGIGGLVGAAAGTLYGLNESGRNDARVASAYRACMHRRGYTD